VDRRPEDAQSEDGAGKGPLGREAPSCEGHRARPYPASIMSWTTTKRGRLPRSGGDQGWTTKTHLLAGPRTRVAEIDRFVADPESRSATAESNAAMVGCTRSSTEPVTARTWGCSLWILCGPRVESTRRCSPHNEDAARELCRRCDDHKRHQSASDLPEWYRPARLPARRHQRALPFPRSVRRAAHGLAPFFTSASASDS
jgi:hypothetical protein